MSFTTMLVLACLVMLGVSAYVVGAIAHATRRRNIRSAALVADVLGQTRALPAHPGEGELSLQTEPVGGAEGQPQLVVDPELLSGQQQYLVVGGPHRLQP